MRMNDKTEVINLEEDIHRWLYQTISEKYRIFTLTANK